MAAHVCKRSTASVASLCKQPASQSSLQIMQWLPGSCSAGLLQATRRGVAAALQQLCHNVTHWLFLHLASAERHLKGLQYYHAPSERSSCSLQKGQGKLTLPVARQTC